ncbi:hypothetical protein BSZ39_10330 [Bowdeniella nasicola]|uniref:Uncharacterized protein n=1 Tax=Bowdeniella nasicola TaxID=208480 RepID=A0A1Q5Q086_9ACTO|nr:hypothetical protein [Bowdeniella nasicola]OKL53274.1 hypothetical protein BSZ39_10330 [Bowdeniella nasicola]
MNRSLMVAESCLAAVAIWVISGLEALALPPGVPVFTIVSSTINLALIFVPIVLAVFDAPDLMSRRRMGRSRLGLVGDATLGLGAAAAIRLAPALMRLPEYDGALRLLNLDAEFWWLIALSMVFYAGTLAFRLVASMTSWAFVISLAVAGILAWAVVGALAPGSEQHLLNPTALLLSAPAEWQPFIFAPLVVLVLAAVLFTLQLRDIDPD